jgi:asparagine synthase (glutamine-hydrolysing)
MACAQGRYWITFNGEIFNFRELRTELEGLGHRFHSETDTEVLLAAFAQWGPDCQERLNGMWAFAIWDAWERRLFLSRDRFGVKPLYVAMGREFFAFASELKAFAELPLVDGVLDPVRLAAAVADPLSQECGAETLIRGVERLLPGHCMVVDADGGSMVTAWWSLDRHGPITVPRGLSAQAEAFRALFMDACGLRMRSDVPLATALSGGLDSSCVAAGVAHLGRNAATRSAPEWRRAYVAAFPGTALDETDYARQVADAVGLSLSVVHDHMKASPEVMEESVWAAEAITAGPILSAMALYGAMRADGIVVSMDGHGGDETLGGYHFTVEAEQARALSQGRPLRWLDMRRTLLGLRAGSVAGISGDWRTDIGLWLRRLRTGADAPPPSLGQGLRGLMERTVLPTILRNFDRASMSQGVEVRMPFLDWRLVSFAFSLPDSARIGGGYTKRIAREAMKGLLPDPVRLRTNKIGLGAPLEQWLRGPLREWALDHLNSRDFLDNAGWDGKGLRQGFESTLKSSGQLAPYWFAVNASALAAQFRGRRAG